jgi:hypothetical protein
MAKSPKKTLGRMPSFEPSKQQRKFVEAMTGLKMTHDEMHPLVLNPRTNAPIDKKTFEKAFARELQIGKYKLKSLIGTKFMERLNLGEPWAIQFGFKHIFRWRENDSDVTIGVNNTAEGSKNASMIEVRFVKARERADDDEE